MLILKLINVCFGYGNHLVVDHLDLEVQKGEILTVLGPSGCGKSTFLRLIAGLEKPDNGEIILHQTGDKGKSLRFLFQDYDAFPWYTAWENVERSAPKDHHPTDEEVEIILKEVGLWDSRNRYPRELSGGMQKRLALARCLVTKPSIVLLDEPFSALDVDTQQEMYSLLQKLWQEFQQTIILVTHDLHEATLLGEKVLVSTPLPFRVRKVVEVPFAYPRTDSIPNNPKYMEISYILREALRLST